MAGDVDFLVREHRGEVVERDTVADFLGQAPVDFLDFGQREVFLAGFRGADGAEHGVAVLESEEFDLRHGDIDVVGGGEVVIVGGAQETAVLAGDFEHAFGHHGAVVLGVGEVGHRAVLGFATFRRFGIDGIFRRFLLGVLFLLLFIILVLPATLVTLCFGLGLGFRRFGRIIGFFGNLGGFGLFVLFGSAAFGFGCGFLGGRFGRVRHLGGEHLFGIEEQLIAGGGDFLLRERVFSGPAAAFFGRIGNRFEFSGRGGGDRFGRGGGFRRNCGFGFAAPFLTRFFGQRERVGELDHLGRVEYFLRNLVDFFSNRGLHRIEQRDGFFLHHFGFLLHFCFIGGSQQCVSASDNSSSSGFVFVYI